MAIEIAKPMEIARFIFILSPSSRPPDHRHVESHGEARDQTPALAEAPDFTLGRRKGRAGRIAA
jgi:hypothetical protein